MRRGRRVRLPRRVISADWSVSPKKRWAARAELQADRRYVVGAPKTITPSDILAAASEPSTLVGFDFPIGLPTAYARLARVRSFTELLPLLGTGAWSSFFEVARTTSEVSLHRPFYPHAPGGKKREHLVDALGLQQADDLYRACDVASGRRACPMFWTLGGNQVGKGALTGWKEVVVPALATGSVDLWPFDGSFEDLLAAGRTVFVETYPADTYAYVGATLPRTPDGQGKRARSSRMACADAVIKRAAAAELELATDLLSQLRDGFGDRSDGEDRFDAVMGLLGMLAVLRGERPVGVPDDRRVHRVEGWILGRTAAAATAIT